MSSQDARVAWVESPLQLLNAVEWAAARDQALNIALRAATSQVAITAERIESHLPAGVTVLGEFETAGSSPFAGASQRLIGDVHSGQVATVLASRGVRDAVVVDDGSAAGVAARQIALGVPLIRSGQVPAAHARALLLVAARRLRAAARGGRLELFTAYAGEDGVARLAGTGATIVENRYAWVRGMRRPGAAVGGRVVLGSALAVDGHLRRDAYQRWLERTAAPGAAYFPHRRESERDLDRYRLIRGLRVHEPELPVELELASAVGLRSVTSLPSSAVTSLRHVLGGDIEIVVDDVPDEWWAEDADPEWRRTIQGMARGGDDHD